MHLSEARLPVAVRNGRFGSVCGVLVQSIVLIGFSKNNIQRRDGVRA
jgi:hypothetical protein